MAWCQIPGFINACCETTVPESKPPEYRTQIIDNNINKQTNKKTNKQTKKQTNKQTNKTKQTSTPVVRRQWWRASSPNTEHKLLSHRTQGTGLYAIIYRIKQRYLTNPPHMYEYVKYVWQFSKSLFRTSLKLYDVVGLNFVACHFHNNLKLE